MVLFPIYFFYVLWFYFLYISFIFYGSIKAITEAIYKWFYFLSTASVWTSSNRNLWTQSRELSELRKPLKFYLFMYDKKESHHHPNKHTILYVFRAPGYNLPVLLSWYKHL